MVGKSKTRGHSESRGRNLKRESFSAVIVVVNPKSIPLYIPEKDSKFLFPAIKEN